MCVIAKQLELLVSSKAETAVCSLVHIIGSDLCFQAFIPLEHTTVAVQAFRNTKIKDYICTYSSFAFRDSVAHLAHVAYPAHMAHLDTQ